MPFMHLSYYRELARNMFSTHLAVALMHFDLDVDCWSRAQISNGQWWLLVDMPHHGVIKFTVAFFSFLLQRLA